MFSNKIMLLLLLGCFAQAQLLEIKNEWKLFGAKEDISTNIFNEECVKIVWKYVDGNWQAFSANTETQQSILNSSISTLESVNDGEGFWAYGKTSCELIVGNSAIYNSSNFDNSSFK